MTASPHAQEVIDRLHAIWRGILDEDLPEEINFFSAGGDSLKAAQLIARVNLEFDIELTLRDIFFHSDLADFATQVLAQRSESQDESTAAASDPSAALWPSSMQERRLRHIGRAAREGHALPNLPCGIVCELDATVTDDAVEDAINAIVSRHDALRSGFSFTPDGEVGQFFVVPNANVRLHRLSLPGTPRSQRSQVILRQLAEVLDEPLSLREPPLAWARLCRFSDDHAALILAFEHLICDGTSLDLIFDELAAALDGTLAARPRGLQHSDWVRRSRDAASGHRRDELLCFWRGLLGDSLPYPELGLPSPPPRAQPEQEAAPNPAQVRLRREVPGHRASGSAPAVAGVAQVVQFAADDLRLVRTELGPLGITIFMATLACIARAWRITTNREDMVIHTPVDNRRMNGADTVVGWLSHAVVLRLSLAAEQASWADRLRATRDLVVDALAHQDLPLSEIIKEFQPEVYNPGPRRARLFYRYTKVSSRCLPIPGGTLSDWIPEDDFTWTDAGITFLATEDDHGCALRLIYDASGVDSSFVSTLRSHLDQTWQDLVSAAREQAGRSGAA